jgi:hypothetical protein
MNISDIKDKDIRELAELRRSEQRGTLQMIADKFNLPVDEIKVEGI